MNHLIFCGILILGQYSVAQMVAPTAPVYETCGQVDVPNEEGHGTHKETDQACLNRNGIKQRDYNAAMDAYNRGTQMISSNNQELVRPATPQYETCQVVHGEADWSCESRNQAKEREYSIQMSGYNAAVQQQQQERQAAETAEQQRLAKVQADAAARASAQAAQQKNEEGNIIYTIASSVCSMKSAQHAMQFVSGCPYACSWSDLPPAIAYAIFSGMASQQASSNASVGYNACLVSNQLASDGGANCGAAPTPYNPQTYPSTQLDTLNRIFDSNGNCRTAANAAECARVTNNLPPGMSIKDGIAALKNFDKNKPFTVNKDGSITAKNGKTYTAQDFSSEAAMIAAGMSAAEAKALAASLKKSGFDAKSALAKENSNSSAFADNGSGASSKGKGATLNGNASGAEKNIGGGKRELASAEGLSKDFNGEMIGVAGDDIFKMMNRRYKLKTAQDNFITP